MFQTLMNLLKYKFIKVDKNKWFFTSFNGDYSDNPKALSEKLHEMYPSISIVWGIDPRIAHNLPNYIITVNRGSEEEFAAKGSSFIIIENGLTNNAKNIRNKLSIKTRILIWLYSKKKQHVYSSWHGTPLKRLDRDQLGNEDIVDFVCNPFTMFVGNDYTKDIMRHLTFEKIKVISFGMPRNDVLFSNSILNFKPQLRLPLDKKIVLFAPTFRNDGRDVDGKNIKRSGLEQLDQLNISTLLDTLKTKFGGEWIFVCRFHYHVSNMVDWEQLEKQYPNMIYNGNCFNDMAMYLASADVLITDASSSMFDFSLTKRPCFIYFPDLNHYKNVERGFYIEIEDLPFSIAETPDYLYRNILEFDETQFTSRIDKMLLEFGNSEDGNASERIIEHILKESKNA